MNVQNKLFLIVALMQFVASPAFSQESGDEEVDDGAPIATVIGAVREALVEAQSNNAPGFPGLTSVAITLQTKATVEEGVGVRFLIFTLGSRRVEEASSSIVVNMIPPETNDAQGATPPNLTTALAAAIQTAKSGLLAANDGYPPLSTCKVTIDVAFTIARTRGGVIDSGDLLPLGLNGTRNASRNQVQKVTLTFSSDDDDCPQG